MPPPGQTHLQALAVLAVEARERHVDLLRDRWRHLDRTDPIVSLTVQTASVTATETTRDCWVAAHQITDVDGERWWGTVNNRGYTYEQNMQSLAACDTAEAFTAYLDDLSWTQLKAHPGPCGPLFTTGGDGRHRTHIMKALALPAILIRSVTFPCVAHRAGDRARVGLDSHRWTSLMPALPIGATEEDIDAARAEHTATLRRLHAQQLRRNRDTLEHLQALEAAAIITDLTLTRSDIDYSTAHFTLNRDLPAYWALELPADVERISRRYARSYPQFAQTPDGAAMCDQHAWTAHLLGASAHPQTRRPRGMFKTRRS